MIWPDDFVNQVVIGDCLQVMADIPDETVQTCITSPPYWGLRSYLPNGVRLKDDVPQEIIRELEQLGIFPLDGIEI